MTPHGSYIWHPDYGGGLGSFIGGPANVGQVQGVIQEQMDMESSVQSVVSIDVSFEPTNSIMSVSIVYVDLSDDSNQLSFTVGK
jgi:phage baseplate assembly protein W